jgi:hypothetical protein
MTESFEENCRRLGLTPQETQRATQGLTPLKSARTFADLLSPDTVSDVVVRSSSVFAHPAPLTRAQRDAITADLAKIERYRSGSDAPKAMTAVEARRVMAEFHLHPNPSPALKGAAVAAAGIIARGEK